MPNFSSFRRNEARAINSSNLKWSAISRNDVDYLTARAFSECEMGALLERMKWGGDVSCLNKIVKLLNDKFKSSHHRRPMRSLVLTSIREYMDGNCKKCGGKCVEFDGRGIPKECDKCSGTGEHNYLDSERANMASVSLESWENLEYDYNELLNIIKSSVSKHIRSSIKALG